MEVIVGILGVNELKVWREQYLEEYVLVSMEEGETAKEKATIVRGEDLKKKMELNFCASTKSYGI